MLSRLTIKNIALIHDLSIELRKGLNVLSGETGAGKSIIIDSLSFVLGAQADRTLIRHGETSARVEAVFDLEETDAELTARLDEADIECEEKTVIVTRSMTSEKSECRINGRTVTLATLRGVVALLIDIHSQNEHQSLLKIANHIKLLDAYGGDTLKAKEEFSLQFLEYKKILAKLDELLSGGDRERRLDILNYQIEEIERIAWKENEEEELLNKKALFSNAQKIQTTVSDAKNSLDGYGGTGALPQLKKALVNLTQTAKYDEKIEPLLTRLDSAMLEVADILSELSNYGGSFDGIDIDKIEGRLDEIRSVKRKYGRTINDVSTFLEKAKEERDFLANAVELIEQLEKKKTHARAELLKSAAHLHEKRLKAKASFEKKIQDNLKELGMKNAKFEVSVVFNGDVDAFTNFGGDAVEFMLSPNAGEPLKPLIKIASGGEISRFMLALKNVSAELDNIGTLIFDEIDTGISGAVAKVVACKLYDIAKSRQVVAITHLPSLAAMADANFLIEKRVTDEKTKTSVEKLSGEKVFDEIMRLSGALENSEVGRLGAKELKAWADNYKKGAHFHN